MMKYFKIILLLFLLISKKEIRAQLPNADPLYDSVFVENFNSSSLNTSEWRLQYPWGTFYNSNFIKDSLGNPASYCSGDTLFVASLNMSTTDTNNRVISGGTCKLKLKKENNQGTIWKFGSPCNSPVCAGKYCMGSDSASSSCLWYDQIPFKYSNSMLMSSKLFKYGYFIIKFRIQGWTASNNNGYIPNFWLYNGNSSTAPWSEIDVFEIKGNNGQLTNNIHINNIPYSTGGPSNDPIPNPPGEPLLDLSQWHTASVHWTPDFLDFYVDGSFIRRSTNSINQSLIEMPLIAECSIPQLFNCILPNNSTAFPIVYEIDYIKAYQPVLACDTDKIYCNVTASAFKSKQYKSLTIGGAGCSAVFNNSNATAVGNNYVLLQEGFEVGNNMNMVIKTENCWTNMKLEQRSAGFIQPQPNSFINNYIHIRNPSE